VLHFNQQQYNDTAVNPGSLSLNQRFNIIPIFPKKLIIAQNQLKKVSLVPFVGPINKSAANFKPKRDQNGPL